MQRLKLYPYPLAWVGGPLPFGRPVLPWWRWRDAAQYPRRKVHDRIAILSGTELTNFIPACVEILVVVREIARMPLDKRPNIRRSLPRGFTGAMPISSPKSPNGRQFMCETTPDCQQAVQQNLLHNSYVGYVKSPREGGWSFRG
jgi:hypothetical protein